MQETGATLRGMGQEVAMQKRGQRVRALVQGQSETRTGTEKRGRHGAALGPSGGGASDGWPGRWPASMRRCGAMRNLGQDIENHLRGMRVDAEASRRKVEEVVRKPSSSPSPGM